MAVKMVLYKGDEPLGVYDSYEECAERMGKNVGTAKYYSMPVHKRRVDAQTTGRGEAWIIERVEDEEGEESGRAD